MESSGFFGWSPSNSQSHHAATAAVVCSDVTSQQKWPLEESHKKRAIFLALNMLMFYNVAFERQDTIDVD
jgi:hypothetical protein